MDLEAKGLLLNEETYRKGLDIANAAIKEVTEYLAALYKQATANRE